MHKVVDKRFFISGKSNISPHDGYRKCSFFYQLYCLSLIAIHSKKWYTKTIKYASV